MDYENWVWTKNKIVHSDQFHPNNILTYMGRNSLKTNAVPSLKLNKSEEISLNDSSFSMSCLTEPFTGKHEMTISAVEISNPSVEEDKSLSKKQKWRKRKLATSISPSKLERQNIMLKNKQEANRKNVVYCQEEGQIIKEGSTQYEVNYKLNYIKLIISYISI